MTRPLVLFVLSADFGEYVTSSLFARGQPFDTHFALPPQLAAFAPQGGGAFTVYASAAELERLVAAMRPQLVVFASGYLFQVNRILPPEALGDLVMRLRAAGRVLATTDPWLRIWRLRPGSRLTIHSVRQSGVESESTRKMAQLQDYLETLFRGLPHLFAVPLGPGEAGWLSFYNREFVPQAPPAPRRENGVDEWLFVISREDFIFLRAGDERVFQRALGERIEELLSAPRNSLRFIGPPPLGEFLQSRWPRHARVEFLQFCDFDAFESAVRRATVAAYWNVLSSSLLYCLYYRTPPIFFGKGHQAKVCDGMYEHVVEHVYRGRPPALLELEVPLGTAADALVARLGLRDWLDGIGADYERLAAPAAIVAQVGGRSERD